MSVVTPRFAGDGPLPARQTPDSSEKGRLSVSQNQRAQSQSFERLVESLFGKSSNFVVNESTLCIAPLRFLLHAVRARITVYLVDCSPVDFIPASGYMCKCLEVTDCVIKSRNLSKSEGSQALAVWFTEENAELGTFGYCRVTFGSFTRFPFCRSPAQVYAQPLRDPKILEILRSKILRFR